MNNPIERMMRSRGLDHNSDGSQSAVDEYMSDVTGDKEALQRAIQDELDLVFKEPEPARSFDIPPINYSAFGDNGPMIHELCRRTLDWLSFPYIEDRFGSDHTARVRWKTQFKNVFKGPGLAELAKMQRNKYRANTVSHPKIMLENIELMLEDGTEDEQELSATIRHFFEEHRDKFASIESAKKMSLAERRTVIEQIEDAVVGMLTTISEYSNRVSAPQRFEDSLGAQQLDAAAK